MEKSEYVKKISCLDHDFRRKFIYFLSILKIDNKIGNVEVQKF